MNYQVTDKDGWTLAEGRIQRNREEAARVVERIERSQRIERLVRASHKGPRTGTAAHLLTDSPPPVQPEASVVDFLHQRTRAFQAPMATRMNSTLTAAAVGTIWLTGIGISVGFWSGVASWIFG